MNPRRTEPYSDDHLHRVPCCRCGAPAAHQWSVTVCANARRRIWVAVCTPCDIAFNRHTLEFIGHPDADALMARYEAERA